LVGAVRLGLSHDNSQSAVNYHTSGAYYIYHLRGRGGRGSLNYQYFAGAGGGCSGGSKRPAWAEEARSQLGPEAQQQQPQPQPPFVELLSRGAASSRRLTQTTDVDDKRETSLNQMSGTGELKEKEEWWWR
jgi:hypothetical protein